MDQTPLPVLADQRWWPKSATSQGLNFALRLSEKGPEQRSEGGLGRYEGPKWVEKSLLGAPWGYVTGTSMTFRTVALRSSQKFAYATFSKVPPVKRVLYSSTEN